MIYAIKQLQILGGQIGIEVFTKESTEGVSEESVNDEEVIEESIIKANEK